MKKAFKPESVLNLYVHKKFVCFTKQSFDFFYLLDAVEKSQTNIDCVLDRFKRYVQYVLFKQNTNVDFNKKQNFFKCI